MQLLRSKDILIKILGMHPKHKLIQFAAINSYLLWNNGKLSASSSLQELIVWRCTLVVTAPHVSLKLVMFIKLTLLLGFGTTVVFGWAISVARSDNTFFLWSSFSNYRERAWHALRCGVLWDLTGACCSSVTWTGLWSSGFLFLIF